MKRALILLILLVGGLSTAFLLPDFRQTPSAIRLEIPEKLGHWTSQIHEPTKAERDTLAKDTKFSKAACYKPRDGAGSFFYTGPQDRADVSIVLSGFDLANSIHRPERCMPAQGHEIYRSETALIEVPGGRRLPVRRLLSNQEIRLDEAGKYVIKRGAITYYFFVGHERITENHTRRTLIDIQDRLTKGEAQGWAYISVTMMFKGEHDQGSGDLPDFLANDPAVLRLLGENPPDFETADRAVQQLLGELAEKNIAWDQVRADT